MTTTPTPPEKDPSEKTSQSVPPAAEPEPTERAEDAPPLPDGTCADESLTGFVPTFQPQMPKTDPLLSPAAKENQFEAGTCIGDFQILGVLGRGAFATVYLARQLSLGRQVALKVSENRGSEARTLASLQHTHIVQVYSETVQPEANLRLLCMQFVPGTTLEKVIAQLRRVPHEMRHGNVLLEIIDSLCVHPALFDPSALREREYLGHSDYLEAICWLGARLAEALSHAHTQDVFHRDIKPSNILVNRYGRPFLADFNISLDAERKAGSVGEMFGGTLGYMSPEHLDAFNPQTSTTPEVVDARSDIYSFGVVLYELLTGSHPFPRIAQGQSAERLQAMAVDRREKVPDTLRTLRTDEGLKLTLQRCLESEPAGRYGSAEELVRALEDCRERQQINGEMPAPGLLTRLSQSYPVSMLALLCFVPHLIGSFVNITYNRLRIVENLSEWQRELFVRVTLGYNAIVYPICLVILFYLCRPILRLLRELSRGDIVTGAESAKARKHLLRLPLVVFLVSCVGWFPGAILFPWVLDVWGGGLEANVFGHFGLSFALSGLIAVTYSVLGAELMVVRVLYPRFLLETHGVRRTTQQELGPLLWRFRLVPMLAGLIPLVGAILMIFVAPEQFEADQYRAYRLLVTALIALGMLGFSIALAATSQLNQASIALLGTSRRSPKKRPSLHSTTPR